MRLLLILTSSCVFLVACNKPQQTTAVPSNFAVTNLVSTNGANETILLFTNGVYFGFQTNMVSVDIHGEYGSWLYYDPVSQKPKKMVHQFYGTNNYWLTDSDADGIPDTKVDYNPGPKKGFKSIFLKGDWIEADIHFTNATATIDGMQKSFTFQNGKWHSAD